MNLHLSFPVNLAAAWDSPDTFSIQDNQVRDWLLNTESLTDRVVARCEHFELLVVGEQQGQAHSSEVAALSSDAKSYSVSELRVREVVLLGDGQPWIFARSIVPQVLWQSAFEDLNTQPLGQRLFTDSRFTRLPFEIAHLTQPNPLLAKLGLADDAELWARRSVFSFEQQQMLVAEVFLPDSPMFSINSRVQG